MLIDWFTVGAQVVNFLILVGLLRWLLYSRIIRAMDQREQKIATRIENAEKIQGEAQKTVDEYDHKREQLEEEREAVLEQVRAKANERRAEMLKDAREEVEASREEWLESLRREKETFLKELRNRAGQEIIAIARQTIEEMADVNLEERMAAELVRRLQNIDEEKIVEIAEAIYQVDGLVTLRSAFELSEEAAGNVGAALKEIQMAAPKAYQIGLQLDREVEPELICGIELEASGSKIGWSIEDYLDRLEEEFENILGSETRPRTPDVNTGMSSKQ